MSVGSGSFVEVSSPGWAFWRAMLDTCIGLVVGTLYTFLGMVVVGVVGEEALASLYAQIDLDPLFRASMGVILLAGALLGIGVPFVLVAERRAALRAVEASAQQHPDAVPQRSLRLELKTAPSVHLRTTGTALFWCFAGLGTLYAIAIVLTEDLREDPINWLVLLGLAVAALCSETVRRLGRRGVERDAARIDRLTADWKRLVPRAVVSDADRRDAAPAAVIPRWLTTPGERALGRIAKVLLAATLIALAAFMLSVFMRQQCRTCDPVSWDEPIENGIDVLSLSSGAAIALCAVLGILAWVGGVLLQLFREIALARWAASGGARRVDVGLIEPLLAENRSMVRAQLGLSAVGAGAVIVGVGATWAEWEGMDGPAVLLAAAAVIVIGLVIGWADAPRSRRERQLVRRTAFPGDVGRAGEAARRGTPARRPRRRR